MLNLETMARRILTEANKTRRKAEQWARRASECHRESNAYLDCRDNATMLRKDARDLGRMARYVALGERAKGRRLLGRLDTAVAEQLPTQVWRWVGY